MSIGRRIRDRRKELGMSQEELATQLGYKSKSSVNKIELDIRQLHQSKIKQIAEALHTTTDYIMGWDNEKQSVSIPVLGRVAAGLPIFASGEILDYEEIPEAWTHLGEHFALRIKGDSMYPDIMDGDTVIVRKQSAVDDGEIAIVLINGDDGTCKRIKMYADTLMLVSLNSTKYEPMLFTAKEVREKPVQIIGKVVEIRRKL